MTQDAQIAASRIEDLSAALTEKFGDLEHRLEAAFGELSLEVGGGDLIKVMTTLKSEDRFGFQQLIDLTGCDYPSRADRFEVVYHLLSMTRNVRLRVKVTTDEVRPVPSLRDVYPNADWYEREAFDMYGILFDGQPDLRRILTDYGFEGHPLRKDFPMTGHVEVRWDDAVRRVVYEPVKLVQEFRKFDFLSPWEGGHYVLPGDEKAKV